MFNDKLKKAMEELKLNQTKLSVLTGIGKSGISQYLSGKNVPTEIRQQDIAVSLGLSPDYFSDCAKTMTFSEQVKKLLPEDAANILGVGKETIRKGLRDGVFPWGYAVQTSQNKWTYFINAKKFAEIESIAV